jgi:biopolymer transport protein ExbD
MAHRRAHDEDEGGVNLGLVITPMLDMSFQLLAFFVMIYHPSALEAHIDGRLLPPPPPRTAALVPPGKGKEEKAPPAKDKKPDEKKDDLPTPEPDKQLARLEVDEAQQVALTGAPTGGTFTLTFKGATTDPIPYNASAAVVQRALVELPNVGRVVLRPEDKDGKEVVKDNARVTGPDGGPWKVRLANKLGATDPRVITASGAGLTGGADPAVALTPTTQLVLRRPVAEETETSKVDLQQFSTITVHTVRQGKLLKSDIALERPDLLKRAKELEKEFPKLKLVLAEGDGGKTLPRNLDGFAEVKLEVTEREDPLQESRSLKEILNLLRAELKRLRREPGGEQFTLVIDAAPSLRYGVFIAIQDASKASGFDNIGFGAPAGS